MICYLIRSHQYKLYFKENYLKNQLYKLVIYHAICVMCQ